MAIKIYIDQGHNPVNPNAGAEGNGYREQDLMYTIGKALEASFLSAARQGLFFLPLIFVLPRFFGIQGVEMCQMISDILTFAIAMPMSLHALRQMKNDIAE